MSLGQWERAAGGDMVLFDVDGGWGAADVEQSMLTRTCADRGWDGWEMVVAR